MHPCLNQMATTVQIMKPYNSKLILMTASHMKIWEDIVMYPQAPEIVK